MRASVGAVLAAAVLILSATSVRAYEGYGIQAAPPVKHERRPGAAIGAASANILFVPVRFAVTVVGAGLGGMTGFFTGGNIDAAQDVWGVFEGQNYLSPEVMTGQEHLRFGEYEFAR
jgi:hypothetical protein